ncbi:MAG: hypothetical protein B7X79_01280 [Acidovorax sp. 17-64-282]|nr:MAG: hypothetical protein B7X79_01280 [Acidovorax sp. 17-64-282]
MAERVSRPKTRAILGLMRLNFLSVGQLEVDRLSRTHLKVDNIFGGVEWERQSARSIRSASVCSSVTDLTAGMAKRRIIWLLFVNST